MTNPVFLRRSSATFPPILTIFADQTRPTRLNHHQAGGHNVLADGCASNPATGGKAAYSSQLSRPRSIGQQRGGWHLRWGKGPEKTTAAVYVHCSHKDHS